MALTLTLGGVNRTAFLKQGSLKLKATADGAQGIADFVLIDLKPSDNQTIVVADGATTYYSGRVRSRSVNEYKVGHYYCTVSCQDDAVAFGSVGASPFALSDTPDGVTSFAYISLQMKTESPRGASYTAPSTTGTVKTRRPGLAPGQQLTITSGNHGLSAVAFNIVALETTFDVDGTPLFSATIGDSPIRLADTLVTQIAGTAADPATALAKSLNTVGIVTSLPALPSATWPEGRLAYLTTDDKLYRSLGASWSKAVDGADLVVASITAGAIAAGAIGTAALAAGAITAEKISVGSIDPSHLSSDNSNLIPYPGAEGPWAINANIATLQGWTFGTGWNVRNNGAFMRSGNAAFQFISTDTSVHEIRTAFLPVLAGRSYLLRGYLSGYSGNTGNVTPVFKVTWFDSTQAGISSSFVSAAAVGTSAAWTTMGGTYVTAPTGAVWAQVVLQATAATTGNRAYADDFEFYAADTDINHAAGTVMINSSGVTVTNGAITVTNPGSTVIIDGTSNMFKIQATGTLSVSWPTVSNSTASNSATITGSGSSPLATAWLLTPDNTDTTQARLAMTYIAPDNSGHTLAYMYAYSVISSGNNLLKILLATVASHPFDGKTGSGRYYLLKEAGI